MVIPSITLCDLHANDIGPDNICQDKTTVMLIASVNLPEIDTKWFHTVLNYFLLMPNLKWVI